MKFAKNSEELLKKLLENGYVSFDTVEKQSNFFHFCHDNEMKIFGQKNSLGLKIKSIRTRYYCGQWLVEVF